VEKQFLSAKTIFAGTVFPWKNGFSTQWQKLANPDYVGLITGN